MTTEPPCFRAATHQQVRATRRGSGRSSCSDARSDTKIAAAKSVVDEEQLQLFMEHIHEELGEPKRWISSTY